MGCHLARELQDALRVVKTKEDDLRVTYRGHQRTLYKLELLRWYMYFLPPDRMAFNV